MKATCVVNFIVLSDFVIERKSVKRHIESLWLQSEQCVINTSSPNWSIQNTRWTNWDEETGNLRDIDGACEGYVMRREGGGIFGRYNCFIVMCES